MNKTFLISLSVLVGFAFLVIAFLYFTTAASALPHFFPGYDALVTKTHFKHGLGALFVGLGCFILAWFQSGKKSAKKEN